MKINERMKPYQIGFGMDDNEGMWEFPFRSNRILVIASHGLDWDHVSVSLHNRCPNWEEMSFVKEMFFEPEECVMQLHPPQSKWISNHRYCLHLWRPQKEAIPMPPDMMVGVREWGELDTEEKRRIAHDHFLKVNAEHASR